MHTEVFSSARVRLERPVHLVYPVRPTRSDTPYLPPRNYGAYDALARAAQPAETFNYLRINLKPRPEWMYGKNARSSSQMFPATLSRASSSKRPRAIESSPS